MKKILSIILFSFLGIITEAQTVGVLGYTEEVEKGYILFAPSSNRQIYLIDECGFKVNEWEADAVPGLMARLDKNGSLIYAQRTSSSTFKGGGIGGTLVSFAWSGEKEWTITLADNDFHQHHDFEIMPNGNLLVLGWQFHTQEEAINEGNIFASLDGFYSERIIEIKVNGDQDYDIVWEWNSWNHYIQEIDPSKPNYGIISDHPERMNINYLPNGLNQINDWKHANSIDYNPELDQVLINFRSLGEFWIIDHSTTIEEAASSSGGKYNKGGDILYRWGNPFTYQKATQEETVFYGQHDGHWIDYGLPGAGSIQVFNNGIGRPEGNYSTVEIVIPALMDDGYELSDGKFMPETSTTIYGNKDSEFIYSSRISGSQTLPNGNTLICVGNPGYFIEINENREIVWEYQNPAGTFINSQGDLPGNSNGAFQAIKYSPNFEGFIGKVLSPTEKIELNPIDNCDLTPIFEIADLTNFKIKNTLVGNQLYIENPNSEKFEVYIYNLTGQVVYNKIHDQTFTIIDTDFLEIGSYIVYITNYQNSLIEKIFHYAE